MVKESDRRHRSTLQIPTRWSLAHLLLDRGVINNKRSNATRRAV